MSRRYHSQEYLDIWTATGRYPTIHATMWETCLHMLDRSAENDGRILDLFSSTGLLGAHLRAYGYKVAWSDGDSNALDRGIIAGAIDPEHLFRGRLTMQNWEQFLEWLGQEDIRTIVARRCLDVLFDVIPPDTAQAGFLEVGVDAIVLEGLVVSSRMKHPYGSADSQVAALAPGYRCWGGARDCRYLARPRPLTRVLHP